MSFHFLEMHLHVRARTLEAARDNPSQRREHVACLSHRVCERMIAVKEALHFACPRGFTIQSPCKGGGN